MKLKQALENWDFIDDKIYFIAIHQKDNYLGVPLFILDKGSKIKEFLYYFNKFSNKNFTYYYGSKEDGYIETTLTKESLMDAIVQDYTKEAEELYSHLYNHKLELQETIEEIKEELGI